MGEGGGRRAAPSGLVPFGLAAREATALPYELVERSPDLIVLLDGTTIRYMNPAAAARTGWEPAQMLGHSITELVHPDDLERAAFDLELYSTQGTVVGSSSYRVALADGSWARFDVAAADITVGGRDYMALYCRPDDSASVSVLYGLLRGTSTAETLRPVCDVINWHIHGSRVGISWWDDDGRHSVGIDLPPSLVGGDDDDATPWTVARSTATAQRATVLSGLDEVRRAQAERLGLGAYWIEPVLDDDEQVSALVTLWMRAGGPVPEIHTLGMSMAKDYTELIVRWRQQRRKLDEAAHRDPLTGLANRKAFFEALEQESGGAALYCDLDRFKPVNDELGHVAGDELLRAVAGRIQACVRPSDVVARLGGDEFAVLCTGVTRSQAFDLAERIRAAVIEPFSIGDTIARVDISIGVAHSPDHIGDRVLELADRALYRAKAAGGSVYCWPE